jgi:plasmanylethanolamine desaturase
MHGSSRPRRGFLGRYDYPTSHRVFELLSLASLLTLGAMFSRWVIAELGNRWSLAVAFVVVGLAVAAFALADLLSGVVHFLFDTVGSPDTPIIGQKFIKPFRDHHSDPLAMTRGDFVAVNADNFFVCLPVLTPAVTFLDVSEHPYLASFLLALMAPVLMTNQIHKWAHVPRAPRLVQLLQNRGLVLSIDHHDVHHSEPRNRNYCITWGAMDRVLNACLSATSRRRVGTTSRNDESSALQVNAAYVRLLERNE